VTGYVINGDPATMTYSDYLDSRVWRSKRRAVRRRANYRCEECGTMEALFPYGPKFNVHHLRYPKVLGTEPLTDLVLLCPDCHAKKHGDPRGPA